MRSLQCCRGCQETERCRECLKRCLISRKICASHRLDYLMIKRWTHPFDRNMAGRRSGGSGTAGVSAGTGERCVWSINIRGTCTFMEFGGVYENCTVWVNEKCAGGHKYGYSTSYQAEGVCSYQEAGCLGIAAKPEIWRERLQHLRSWAATQSGQPTIPCGRVHRSV